MSLSVDLDSEWGLNILLPSSATGTTAGQFPLPVLSSV